MPPVRPLGGVSKADKLTSSPPSPPNSPQKATLPPTPPIPHHPGNLAQLQHHLRYPLARQSHGLAHGTPRPVSGVVLVSRAQPGPAEARERMRPLYD